MDFNGPQLQGDQYWNNNGFLTEEYTTKAFAERQSAQAASLVPVYHEDQSWRFFPALHTYSYHQFAYPEGPLHIRSPYPEEPLNIQSQYPEEPLNVQSPYPEEPLNVQSPYPEELLNVRSPYPEEPLNIQSPSFYGAGFQFANQQQQMTQFLHEQPQVLGQPMIAPSVKAKRERHVAKPPMKNLPCAKAAAPRSQKKAGSLATTSKYRSQPYKRKARVTPVSTCEEYQVDVIKDSRKTQGQVKYLIKWQGWPAKKHWTWEPFDHLESDGAKAEARHFHKMNPGKPADDRVFLQDMEARSEIEEEGNSASQTDKSRNKV
ncbi:hypothetical protein FHL15_005366 [Xylaria flabelliformis]|uniref:Chromo domain-containing protein n=1 Tax=Xylaria flabelliformis TaxID=2512241 RepID=A0A553I0F8_9PEZI|nr:hypothetical protein FHL15_005366 [Xylaria flabelliformis]